MMAAPTGAGTPLYSSVLGRMEDSKAQDAYRTISEAADMLDLPQHVLRFWEGKFPQIKPLKRSGNRRYYRPADVETLLAIKQLLHEDGYTIRGVQKLFKEQGLRSTVAMALGRDDDSEGASEPEAAPSPKVSARSSASEPAGSDGTVPASDARSVPAKLADRETLKEILITLKAVRAQLD